MAEEYEGMFIYQTDAAILFVPDGQYNSQLEYDKEDTVWLPKFKKNGDELIEYEDIDYEKGDPITISVPDWLAKEKGLI